MIDAGAHRCVLLLEDIDAAFLDKRGADSAADAVKYAGAGSLTLSGVLNALDGVASCEERVVFMTTNHPERLDAALIRPGRVDRRVYVGDASDVQVREMFAKFFEAADDALGRCFLEALRSAFPGRGISCAQLQGHFVMYKDDAQGAVDNVARVMGAEVPRP